MTSSYMHFRPLDGPKLGIKRLMPLRSTGLSIPQLGFGTYRLSPEAAEEVVPVAINAGFRHFDCAKAYLNQKGVGRGLQRSIKSRRLPREQLFITSKLWPTDQHPDFVRSACVETIRELGVGYLDLYLMHWPVCWKHSRTFTSEQDKYPTDEATGAADVDPDVTLLDTWKAMSELVGEGLVKSIGVCNCGVSELDTIMQAVGSRSSGENGGEECQPAPSGLVAPVLNQIEFHPACQDSALVKVHKSYDMLTAAYCPLGMPTRTTPPGFVPLLEDEMLKSLENLTGFSVARLLLNWSLDLQNVVICKSASHKHILSNAKASQFALSDPVRLLLNSFNEKVRSFRVMNPKNFTATPGKPFFPVLESPNPLEPFGPYRL